MENRRRERRKRKREEGRKKRGRKRGRSTCSSAPSNPIATCFLPQAGLVSHTHTDFPKIPAWEPGQVYSSRTSCPRKVRASIPPLSGNTLTSGCSRRISRGCSKRPRMWSLRQREHKGWSPSVPSGSPGTTAAPNVLDMCNPRAPPSVAPEHCRVWPPSAQSKGNRPLLVPQSLLQGSGAAITPCQEVVSPLRGPQASCRKQIRLNLHLFQYRDPGASWCRLWAAPRNV